MSSYSSFLPTAARGLLSPCRASSIREKSIAPFLVTSRQQIRGAKSKSSKGGKKGRKGPTSFKQKDLKDVEQYSLCDAIRYLLSSAGESNCLTQLQIPPCIRSRPPAEDYEIRTPYPPEDSKGRASYSQHAPIPALDQDGLSNLRHLPFRVEGREGSQGRRGGSGRRAGHF